MVPSVPSVDPTKRDGRSHRCVFGRSVGACRLQVDDQVFRKSTCAPRSNCRILRSDVFLVAREVLGIPRGSMARFPHDVLDGPWGSMMAPPTLGVCAIGPLNPLSPIPHLSRSTPQGGRSRSLPVPGEAPIPRASHHEERTGSSVLLEVDGMAAMAPNRFSLPLPWNSSSVRGG